MLYLSYWLELEIISQCKSIDYDIKINRQVYIPWSIIYFYIKYPSNSSIL
jgi:hypothetical protein